jgi:hypothetical protein
MWSDILNKAAQEIADSIFNNLWHFLEQLPSSQVCVANQNVYSVFYQLTFTSSPQPADMSCHVQSICHYNFNMCNITFLHL